MTRVRPIPAFLLALCAMLALASSAVAQGQQPTPCAQPECRQFDFWIGEWDVYSPDGKLAGRNSIQSILSGCVLQENWKSEGSPFAGTSYNMYDAASKKWHQTWVDNSGRLLELNGAFTDGRMVLWGTRPASKEGGMPVIHRIAWERKSEGEVRQLWEFSPDGGVTWNVAFDGKYVRRGR